MISFKHKTISTKGLIGCGLTAVLALMGCADWNDHYDQNTSVLGSQQSSLWENIENNGQLTQFASLLKKAGYDKILQGSQTYTVWAPVDGSFDYDALTATEGSLLLKEFIQNHVARNNYPASGTINNLPIYMLNEKMMHFDGSGAYTMQGVSVAQPNLASSNGTIHTLNGKLPFMQNIYESLFDKTYPLDSIANYFQRYDIKEIDPNRSVAGPIINGELTYLDTVYNENNILFRLFHADIQQEDSNFTMIVPTNDAWNKAKATISKYYNYIPSFEFMKNTETGTNRELTKIEILDTDFLKDSVVNMNLVRDLFYNNNLYDHKKLNNLQEGQVLQCDSLYSTTFSKIYSEDAAALFTGMHRADKSNGTVWITDTLRMHPWTSWNPEIKIEAEMANYVSSYSNVAESDKNARVRVLPSTQNPAVTGTISNDAYLEVPSISTATNPGVVFYLPDVRSTTYKVGIVIVPANIISTYVTPKPNYFNVTMGYADETGKNIDNYRDWRYLDYFESNIEKVDTIWLGEMTFPIAYIGTDSYPYIRVTSAIRAAQRDTYDRTLRIDCLILRPKELADYIEAHPDYKYDDGKY